MSTAYGVLVLLHGIAFWTTSIAPTGLLGDDQVTAEVLLFGDRDPGSLLMWIVAVAWMAVGAGLVAAGVALLRAQDRAVTALVLSLPPAIALTTLWVRQSPGGLIVTALIVAGLVIPAARRRVLP